MLQDFIERELLLRSLTAEYSRRKFFTGFSTLDTFACAGNGASVKGLEMVNSRYPQLFSRARLAETAMCRRIFVAHSVVASGIGEVLSGFVVLTSDPSGGSGI